MELPFFSMIYLIIFNFDLSCAITQQPTQPPSNQSDSQLSADRTQAIALLFSLIQCFPDNTTTTLDAATQNVLTINQNFNPSDHLSEYVNLTEIQNLIDFVAQIESSGTPVTLPFLNDPVSIANLQTILIVLYRNAENWPLFYNTSAWLLQRVNTAQLFWCLNIVVAEKFTETVTLPSTAEVFPQLYIPKQFVLAAAGLPNDKYISENPLYYWTTDPGINEFHTHFHMDMPFWWDASYYGIFRHRKGELFLHMHHQVVNRYNAELLSHGLPEVVPLGLLPDYQIPFGYEPDIVNVDYAPYPPRPDNWPIGSFDDGPNVTLADLRQMYDRMWEGIDMGYFHTTDGGEVSLRGFNGSDVLGATVESSNVYSADFDYYGSYHNLMHQYLSGMLRNIPEPSPGVQAHQETSMRDRIFYQIHKSIDVLYVKLKNQLTTPYKKEDLQFSGIAILGVKILTNSEQPSRLGYNTTWPFIGPQQQQQPQETPILTTYMQTETFDISNAARPCHSLNDEPILAQVQTLNHVPFTYQIYVQSMRPKVAYGMVRIFIWPESLENGTQLEGDEAHVRAIELDRFRVRLNPTSTNVITRGSRNSIITRTEPSPGIKQLYNVKPGAEILVNPEIRRACGFPNNLLIPKGTREGLRFKMTVYISDETDAGEIEENQFPHYPMCGALNGLPFPDKRPMGFPFDRPGTKFSYKADSAYACLSGCSELLMTNVRQMDIVIKHDDKQMM